MNTSLIVEDVVKFMHLPDSNKVTEREKTYSYSYKPVFQIKIEKSLLPENNLLR